MCEGVLLFKYVYIGVGQYYKLYFYFGMLKYTLLKVKSKLSCKVFNINSKINHLFFVYLLHVNICSILLIFNIQI